MVLLLPGAIDIKGLGVPSMNIVDIEVRLSQYLNSIEYAILHYKTISEIVFVENTGYKYDYSGLQEQATRNGKKLEIISFRGDYSKIIQKGKGFGEGESIKYALDKSDILKRCNQFFKLTGRLIVKNMDEIVETTRSASSFIYHPKTIYRIYKDHIETYFYKVDKKVYVEYLIDAHQDIDESDFRYLEHVFYEKLSFLDFRSFKTVPLISGFSGTSGNPYDLDTKRMILEKINYFIGAHNLKKTAIEKVLTQLLSWLFKIRRLFK
jgi:hypothetical protein